MDLCGWVSVNVCRCDGVVGTDMCERVSVNVCEVMVL